MGGNVDVVGTIHRGGIIFWHVHFHLPDSITKYSIEWNVDFSYHLETKLIFCCKGTKFLAVAMEVQYLLKYPWNL